MISHIHPVGSMALLSRLEVNQLQASACSEIYQLFRNCSLAVLNSGSQTDSTKAMLAKHKDFKINLLNQERGVKIELHNPPADAFIDGILIKSIQAHLFAVLRDLLYVDKRLELIADDDQQSTQITSLVFAILRNADILQAGIEPNVVACWGGHSINDSEFNYTCEVGNQLGLRELNICTGCGPGAMEGPMKGATVAHAKQRIKNGRYIGLTEPGIIAAEPPNPIVNELVILPDIEKRLEAFVRIAHSIIIFPGGPGTIEELLYVLGIMMHPENKQQPIAIILTGPKESADYFAAIDTFICDTLGAQATLHYQIIIDDAVQVAKIVKESMAKVTAYRHATRDAYSFNWSLKIDKPFQTPFVSSHQNIQALALHRKQPVQDLAANLRRVFSAIVGGNVKEEGIQSIDTHGPFLIKGEKVLMEKVDTLLTSFIKQGRMKLPGSIYTPCYKIIN